jgi:mRNA interferase RelE/StbE
VPEFELRWSRLARKELDRLPSQIAERIFGRIDGLIASPRPPGSLRLKGDSLLWRLRVGDYRVLYAIDDMEKTVSIMFIRHRKDVYRDI